jgi:hypothetical protein
LFFIADDPAGVLAADTEKDWNVEPAVIDPANLLEHIKAGGLQTLVKPGNGVFGAAGLVLVVSILFAAGCERYQSLFHKRRKMDYANGFDPITNGYNTKVFNPGDGMCQAGWRSVSGDLASLCHGR